jgi:abortive infection alpha-like protein
MMTLMSEGEDPTPTERQRLPEMMQPAVDSLPGLARVAASAALHTTEWGVKTSAKAWLRVGRAMTSRDEAVALAKDAGDGVAVFSELARSVSSGVPMAKALLSAGESLGGLVQPPTVVNGQVLSGRETPKTLRERGHELLEKSRDVWNTDQGHPAYERILEQLAPDEGRILLLLLEGGPQPSVDVRTGGPIGMVNSHLVAPGLNMVGARAGARYLDKVPSYLNNLYRLGLIWFSRESLRDPLEYQVVEAQPDVLEAMHSVRFAKVVRRSIHLTPFGEDFCRTCLIDEDHTDKAFPEHSPPPDGDDGPEPPGT